MLSIAQIGTVIGRLMRPGAHVKPAKVGGETGWLVTWGNALTEFSDDWRRYGLAVALHNLAWIVRAAES